MSNYVNTIDVLGDEVTMACILDGTLTELRDDSITRIENKFYNHTGLTEIDLPNLTEATSYAFLKATSLTKVRVWGVNGFSREKFNYGSIRTLIVLRSDTVEPLGNASSFHSNMYLYVPSSIVDAYKTATNWSNRPDNIRALEDYTVDGTVTGELDETKI